MSKLSKRTDPDFISILILLALGLIAYSNSFLASFHFDDLTRILKNEAIFDLTNIGRIYSYCEARFLTYLSLAANYRVSKFDTTSYHIVNFFIHYFAALLVYFLFIETWKTPAMKGSEVKFPVRIAAFLSAGIFLLHPLQTQAVTYIIQRAESMAGMFYLGAILFYVKARLASSPRSTWAYYVIVVLFGLGAAFSKETAVTLPAMIVAYEILFFNTSVRGLLRRRIVLILLIPAAIVVFYQLGSLVRRDFYFDSGTYFTRKQYLLTQFSVLLTYLRLYFWPANQNLDWDYPVAVTFFHVRTFSSLLFLLVLVFLAVATYRKYRFLALAIIGFFVTLAPTSSVIPIKDLIYEHRMYLAVGFLAMGSAYVLWRALEKVNQPAFRGGQIGLILVVVTLLPILTGLTYARNEIWATELSLWGDAVQKSPNKARPHLNYGRALYYDQASEKAKKEFEIARRLCPKCAPAYHNLAFFHRKEGDYEGAVALYLEAIERDPDYTEAFYQLGRLYKELNQWQEARIYLERLISPSPSPQLIGVYLDLIDVYLEMELRNEALRLVEIMTRIPDGLPGLDYYRGMAFYKVQDFANAKRYFTEQAERESKQTATNLMLGKIYYLEGNYEQAEAAFRGVLQGNPWSPRAHSNLAIVLEKRGRLSESCEHLEKVLVVEPFSRETVVRLVVSYNRLGNVSRRTELLRKLLRLTPRSEEFTYLKASANQDLSQSLGGYVERFLSSDTSGRSLEARAIVATLEEDFVTAIGRYQRYLETLNSQSQKKRVTREIMRLERLLNGEETLRTPA